MNQTLQALPPEVLHPYTGVHTITRPTGYVHELCPSHPKADTFGFVSQHRLVVERSLGRYLTDEEQIHHIDRVKNHNAIENLLVCTRSEHMRIHRQWNRSPLTADLVSKALQENGTLKKAAAFLGVHTQTVRNNFPDIVAPYKRKSPTNIDDPKVIALVIQCANNPDLGYRETANLTGISYQTVERICSRRNIPWVRKSKAGEVHRTYRRKTPILTE